MKLISKAISFALIGGGVTGFVLASRPLEGIKEINGPLNILGINRSPYGEVFAMAMQGSIDTYFHAGKSKSHVCDDPAECSIHQADAEKAAAKSAREANGSTGFNDRFRDFIDGMGQGLVERTNTKSVSAAHRVFLRRGVEDNLRFAYFLDPGHYGNYNAYNLFLTEPQLGTRPELTPMAAKLAQDTINYCLARNDDPRYALTAAAAAANVIELMFNDRTVNPEYPRFTTGDMRAMLAVCDNAIRAYSEIAEQWTEENLWQNLSAFRISEIDERSKFVFKVRESQGKAIERLESIQNGATTSLSQ